MFCCSDLESDHQHQPQPPLFPDKNTNLARPCMDQTSHCQRWIKNNPNSCKPDHLNDYGFSSYDFMREVCQETCSKAETNFRSGKCNQDNKGVTKFNHSVIISFPYFLHTW